MEKKRLSLGQVAPAFAGKYDPARQYGFYVFVRDGPNAFISKKPSLGVPTTNEDYWFQVMDFSQLTEDVLQAVIGGLSDDLHVIDEISEQDIQSIF